MNPSAAAHDIPAISRAFAIPGEFLDVRPWGGGHINDTFRAAYRVDGRESHYIHQRINHHVFIWPDRLMENVQRVVDHLRARLANQGVPDLERRTLTLVPDREGRMLHVSAQGDFWRTYVFIEGTRTLDTIEEPGQAYRAARAFGEFQKQLMDFPGPRLHETLPDFHHTLRRFARLERAIDTDVKNRAASVRPEIDFALARRDLAGSLLAHLEAGRLVERITHNDTKLDNVLMDAGTGEGLCVIDLDTVMPGLPLYDFGDMVRTATMPVPEDSLELDRVAMQVPMFEALARGWADSLGDLLPPLERSLLVTGGKLMTFEVGIRFLTDYLDGDTYFKIHREHHNLDRCRTQFALLRSIEQHEEPLARFVETLG